MQKDAAQSQVDTLRTWADMWSREAADDFDPTGAEEVAFLLNRAARQINRTLGDTSEPEIEKHASPADPVEDPKAG